ncbi:MAG: MBOAT family O-acyltransferase [Hydrogenoanaerobacterium sp.]
MALTSFSFLVFFAALFFMYYIIPKKLQWILLLVASIYFYLSAGVKLSLFLLLTTVTIYAGALAIGNMSQKHKSWLDKNKNICTTEERSNQLKVFNRKKKYIIISVLIFNFGILAFLKYAGFFAGNLNKVFSIVGMDTSIPILNLILPLGISFYTFQAIGYLIDVSRGLCEPQHNFAKFALYTCYFPSVMQGPINRYSDLSPQLFTPHYFNYTQVIFGMQRMLWGFLKKLVIADRLALFVNEVYGNWQNYAGFQFVVATVFFAFQLYTDFSGFMDIAIGASQVLGIKLPENFETPFFSRSISEYWRHWHITLGTWFKDYLFYPLLKSDFFQRMTDHNKERFSKKASKAITTYSAMFILWFTIGIWHGSSWKFIVGSGLLHWFYIVLGEICQPLSKKIIAILKIKTDCFSWRLFQTVRTFCLVCVGFVFFRADSFMTALHICKRTLMNLNLGFYLQTIYTNMSVDIKDFIVLIVALIILLIASLLQQKIHIRQKLSEQNLVFRWGIYFAAFFIVSFYSIWNFTGAPNQFIYFQF